MTRTEIVEEIKRLTIPQQLEIIEAILQIIREDLGEVNQISPYEEQSRQLTVAAQALKSDYEMDEELTAFSALDAEDFHA